ncbi:DNA-3-methyladenine glycosylase [Falsirhodobacter halotolerans]|nr:DNA-3-methyladenine glycosylase [Falsirhodobacter halotolerans]MCJ8138832.1 DNA-3-methyladenine glycosylase [Falsirhodobacter halotolerans]
MTPFPHAWFDRPAPDVARDLIGSRLEVGPLAARVVETEAYTSDDPASHSFGGPRPRNRAMFGPAGLAYVYRSYGIHWCLNVVCRSGDAVLLRALEPLAGLEVMARRRGTEAPRALCSGPGKIGQAFGLDAAADGADILRFHPAPRGPVVTGPRIGITRATDRPWRFGSEGSAFLSRRFPGT